MVRLVFGNLPESHKSDFVETKDCQSQRYADRRDHCPAFGKVIAQIFQSTRKRRRITRCDTIRSSYWL
jgi:hypothetical protein